MTHANRTDYPTLLNNLLHGNRTENVVRLLAYASTGEGPEDNATHLVTAKCERYAIE